jgi:hypothetical protein
MRFSISGLFHESEVQSPIVGTSIIGNFGDICKISELRFCMINIT